MSARRPIRFADLDAVELSDGSTRLVIVTEVGPRIASFGSVGGENLLYWDEAGEIRRGEWRLYGGHRLWTTRPLADESEESYAPDNARCTVRELAHGVAVTAPPNAWGIEKTIAVHGRSPHWIIEHRVRNAGDMLWAGGAWAVTATRPSASTRYRIPINGGSPQWDVLTMVIARRWGSHTSRIDDPQITLSEEAIEIQALGSEAKRMVFAPRGTLEMTDPERGTFTKSSQVRAGTYPLNTNVAVHLGPPGAIVELETMSPVITLAPNEELVHEETWSMFARRA